MNQQQEEEDDQGDYEEPGEDEVTDQLEMMWQTDESHFKEAASEILEPEIEDQNVERFWSMLENQGTSEMSPTEAIMSIATGDDSSTKATSLKRKSNESANADTHTNLGKIRKTQAPEMTEELNGQSRANGRAVVKQPNKNVADVKTKTPTSNRKELTLGDSRLGKEHLHPGSPMGRN